MRRTSRLVLLLGVFLAALVFVVILLGSKPGGGGGGVTASPTAAAELPTVVAAVDIPLGTIVTVDMLSTGVDIPDLEFIVFLRPVKSRILFEQMLNRLERHEQAPSQKLLLPATLEFSARDAAFLRKQLPVLVRLGVGVSEFGERTFLLDALPPFVKTSDPRQFVLELVDELRAAGHEVNTLRLGEHMVAKTVCRHAVKAHDPLRGSELEGLLAELRRCTMPYTCPHGRPTLIEMSFRELEKKFGRTQ